jgi:hypothetical protein
MKELQQIYINPTSNNSEILTIQIWHLRSPKAYIFIFTRRKLLHQKGRSKGHVQNGLQQCTSTTVVSPDHLSPAPSTSSAVKTPEHKEKGPDDLEPADVGDIQTEYSSGYLYSSNIEAVTDNCL